LGHLDPWDLLDLQARLDPVVNLDPRDTRDQRDIRDLLDFLDLEV